MLALDNPELFLSFGNLKKVNGKGQYLWLRQVYLQSLCSKSGAAHNQEVAPGSLLRGCWSVFYKI